MYPVNMDIVQLASSLSQRSKALITMRLPIGTTTLGIALYLYVHGTGAPVVELRLLLGMGESFRASLLSLFHDLCRGNARLIRKFG